MSEFHISQYDGDLIRILQEAPIYRHGARGNIRCFLSAYQISVKLAKKLGMKAFPANMPFGGAGEGTRDNPSLTQRVARRLSELSDPRGPIVMEFFSISGLEQFSFRDGFKSKTNSYCKNAECRDKGILHEPSISEFSMFCWNERNA